MKSHVISQQLKEAIKRKQLTQSELSRETYRAKTTMNGYFRGDPTPLDAMQDIANFMDDSILSQQLTNKVFNGIPAMQSDVYKECPHSLDIIQLIESEERKEQKNKAMFAMAKHKEALSEQDKETIKDYAMDFLDEVFVEIRYIISMFDKLDMSLMSAVKKRIPYWKAKNYLRGE